MATTYPSPQLQPPTIPSSSTQPLFLGPPLKNTDSFRTRFRQSRAARVSSHYCCCFPLSSGIWVLSIFLLVSTPSLLPTNKPSTQPTNQPTSVMSQHHPTCLSTHLTLPPPPLFPTCLSTVLHFHSDSLLSTHTNTLDRAHVRAAYKHIFAAKLLYSSYLILIQCKIYTCTSTPNIRHTHSLISFSPSISILDPIPRPGAVLQCRRPTIHHPDQLPRCRQDCLHHHVRLLRLSRSLCCGLLGSRARVPQVQSSNRPVLDPHHLHDR